MHQCPGQQKKSMEEAVSEVPCPGCGYELEFWFYDDKVKCPKCGSVVEKNPEKLADDLSCAMWCRSADKCLTPGVYRKVAGLKK